MISEQATVVTWGCSHNQKDSQLIEKQLLNAGYTLIDHQNMDDADVIVLNTCTVKTPTEDKIIYQLDTLRDTDQTIVVTGCLSQAEPALLKEKYPEYIILGVNAASKILAALGHSNGGEISLPVIDPQDNLNTRQIKDNSKEWIEKPLMEGNAWNPNLNIVQINEGCLNFCSFCATKKARGHLRSYKRTSIIQSIRNNPTPEVWLTSQDTACWGFDIDQNLSHLIEEIDKIERKFWVRIGMGNPNNFIKILDEVVPAFKSNKIYKFLHLPVQAGSNSVLRHMKRGYTVEEYEQIVHRFREEIPGITLSTDVITGYPTESRRDFDKTIETLKKTRPSITNISRYWERKGTPAADMEQLSFEERKRRSNILTHLCEEIQTEDNKSWLGWEGEIYLAEKGVKGGIQGRNRYYKPIIVDEDESRIGTFSRVRITDAKHTYFLGEIIE